ncbi:MAG TPA: DNA damage-inducible protein D [Candidatus Saccharimonadales bacterium]|nr:DNA damage-inducible protein D [Candidatus Saccharimonadales bacterium]
MVEDSPAHVKGFESIKVTVEGSEYWSARELMPLLGYVKWETFANAIEKAQKAAANSGQDVDQHFFLVLGKNDGKGRPAVDYMLTRYACYLVAQNGDPRKREVAYAQTYFAAQTHKQEQFEQLTPEAKRVVLRDEIINNNKRLNTAAKQHGVFNFAMFHDAGYRGLYGVRLKEVTRRKGIGKDSLLDRAGSTELAANLFRITQTEERLHQDVENGKRHGQRGAENVHNMIGGKVRQTIKDIGGVMPENLPAETKHIKELRKELKQDEKRRLAPSEKPLKIDNPEGFDDTIGKIVKSD